MQKNIFYVLFYEKMIFIWTVICRLQIKILYCENIINILAMNETTLVVFAEYNTLMEAQITKSILGSAGIEATIRNEYATTIYPTGVIPAQVIVREMDLQQAESIIHSR